MSQGTGNSRRYDEGARPPRSTASNEDDSGGVDEVLYAGVDAHRAATHITIMDDAGKVLTRKRVSSSPDGLRSIFANYNEPIKAVVEATYNWGPVYDWLDEITDEVSSCESRRW